MYCDQMNSDITTQNFTELLSTFQILCHFKPSTSHHHWLVHCSHPSKWHTYFTDVEEAKCVLQFKQNHSVTLVQLWFRIKYSKEALQESPFTSGTNHLLKLVAFVLRRRRIRAADQVTRLWSMFMHHFPTVHRNP
jgi:hypothetical protein